MNKIITLVVLVVLVLAGGYWFLNNSSVSEINNSPQTTANTVTDASSTGATTDSAAPATTTTASPQPQTTTNTNNKNIMQATLHTSMGDITIEFDTQNAPNTSANFIKLAQSGFYDGTKFHRVIKGFMDQGGDPLTKDDSLMARWGTGGPGYQFADENASAANNAGVVSMANSGPNTNGSQFFINAANNNFLDGKYSVFGKVIAGLDVVMAINNTPTDSSDRPVTRVVLKSVTLQ